MHIARFIYSFSSAILITQQDDFTMAISGELKISKPQHCRVFADLIVRSTFHVEFRNVPRSVFFNLQYFQLKMGKIETVDVCLKKKKNYHHSSNFLKG